MSIFENNVFYNFYIPLFFLILYTLSVLFGFFFLKFLGLYGFFALSFFSVFLFWISLVPYFFIFFKENITFIVNIGDWILINNDFKIKFTIYIDTISYSFVLLTTTIALFVNVYSYFYFRFDSLIEKFIFYLNLFVISMIILVSSGNFVIFFLGWELIGLTSFVLINFWVNRPSTLKSALKAMFFNKISDVSLLTAIVIVFYFTQNLDIKTLNLDLINFSNKYIQLFNINIRFLELLSLLLIISASVKSAQIGFHVWLPDSMEAPVPASALIHSATLVSAGVYLILRFYNVLINSYIFLTITPIIGSLTAFYGGFVAIYQTDIKKILAYSTISHCGYLVLLTTLGNINYTIFYLYVHGFFKATVFLCAGNIIRFFNNSQDFRKMGNSYKYLDFEVYIVFICLVNLSGLPCTLGYNIKHNIFNTLIINNSYIYIYCFLFLFLGSVCGLIYSYLFYYNIFFDFNKNKKFIYNNKNNKFYDKDFSKTSMYSITLLTLVSYIVSLLLIYNLDNFTYIGDFGIDFLKNYYSNNITGNLLEKVSSYNNYIYIFIITLLVFVNFRSYFYNYSFLIFFIFFIIMYFFFLKII